MREHDWALLGIEPTMELGAIKKAYALKLKTTRPDDDAEAYQALRGAYERAQQWAKWQAEAPDEVVLVADLPPSQAEVPATVSELPPDDAPPPSVPAVEPAELVERMELAWRRDGEAGLREAWPAARADLDAQPLWRGAEFSAEFARWVLRLPQLPDAFLATLDEQFGWLGDFRSERVLGFELAEALHQLLHARLVRPIHDPGLHAMAEPLRQISALHRRGRWLWAHVLALLLQPVLAGLRARLGPALLLRLGFEADDQAELKRLARFAGGLRLALLALTFVGLGLAAGAEDVVLRLLSWTVCSLLLLGGALLIGRVLNSGPAWVIPRAGNSLPLQGWRHHRSQPWLGLAMMLLAAGLFQANDSAQVLQQLVRSPTDALDNDGAQRVLTALGLLTATVAVAGLLLAWPLLPQHGIVCVGVAPLVSLLFARWLLPDLAMATSLLLGASWMLIATAVGEGRICAPGLLEWPLRPMLNSLALGDRWGLGVALLPVFAAMAVVLLKLNSRSGGDLFLVWVLGNLAVGWVQGRGEAWALSRLSRAT